MTGLKNKGIKIIEEAFDDNPMINFIIKNDHKRKKRISALATYSYNRSARRDGIFFSSDKEGIALCFQFNKKGNLIFDLIDQLKLVIKAIGINRALDASKRESYRNSIRPTDGNFLYFWYLGVSKKGIGGTAVKELRDSIFLVSKEKNLPIYLETTILKNKIVYERYGFETYHEWNVPNTEITMWFMRRTPKS